jgi:transcriptional regulator with XRE-family HTH domain
MENRSSSDLYRIPIPVRRAVRKLGHDIKVARLRRRIPMALLAQRASISRTTLSKIEDGNPQVSLGLYAIVLYLLGLLDRLAELADMRNDEQGLMLDEEQLPQRIRSSPKRDSRLDMQ